MDERQPAGGRETIRRLDSLSPREMEKIRAINADRGTMVVVHPHHGSGGRNAEFDEFITRCINENHLTLVFEEWGKIKGLRERLARMGLRNSNSLFIVATKTGKGEPTRGWQKTLARMKAIGARDIEVGGRVTRAHFIEEIERDLKRDGEIEKKARWQRKRYSQLRAMRNASAGNRFGHSGCAGLVFSRLEASGRFNNVRLTHKFK